MVGRADGSVHCISIVEGVDGQVCAAVWTVRSVLAVCTAVCTAVWTVWTVWAAVVEQCVHHHVRYACMHDVLCIEIVGVVDGQVCVAVCEVWTICRAVRAVCIAVPGIRHVQCVQQ